MFSFQTSKLDGDAPDSSSRFPPPPPPPMAGFGPRPLPPMMGMPRFPLRPPPMIPPPVSGGQGPRKYFKVCQSASCDLVVTFNHHFHIAHNIPCLTPKISPGVILKRNWKQ